MLKKILSIGFISLVSMHASAVSIDLGAAGGYNIFVKEDLSLKGMNSTGKIAAGGNASIDYAEIGTDWRGENVLVVGGNLNVQGWASNTVKGSAYVGGTTSSNIPGYASNGIVPQNPIDFNAAFNQVSQLSTTLAGLGNTGSIQNQYGGLKLLGSSQDGLYVANYNIFNGAWGVDLGSLQSSDIIIFNIGGTNIDISGKGANFFTSNNNFPLNNILFNFYEAESISIKNGDYFGSFLAPNADISFGSATLKGQAIANSWAGEQGGVSFNSNILFPGYNYNEGGLPGGNIEVPVPEAGAWLLALMGLLSLYVLRRRRLGEASVSQPQTA